MAREEVVLTWRIEGTILVDVLVVAMIPETNKEVLEEDRDGFVVYYYYYKETDHTKYQCPLLKGKLVRDAHISNTLLDNKQFEQFQTF